MNEMKDDIFTITNISSVIPVLNFNNIEKGISACKALYDGGIKIFEITLRTPEALSILEKLVLWEKDIIVGVGTLINPQQCYIAKKAGANFGVCPGLTKELSDITNKINLPLLPGIMTPTELINAIRLGYKIVKFFPAVLAGGLTMLKTLHEVFPDLMFYPTGGINSKMAIDFLNLSYVTCVGGTWLTPRELVETRNWKKITQLALSIPKLTIA